MLPSWIYELSYTSNLPDVDPIAYDWNRAFKLTAELERSCDMKTIVKIIREYPDFDPNSRGRCGWTLLSVAIAHNDFEVVRYLLDRFPRLVHQCGGEIFLAPYIHMATSCGLDLVKLFMEKGATVNSINMAGITPLFIASEENNREVIQYLLLHGAVIGDKITEDLRKRIEDNTYNVIQDIKGEALPRNFTGNSL